MNRLSYSVADLLERGAMEQPRELRQLFHQLNNQLGIILAHAELLEKKAADETSRVARDASRQQRARRDGHRERNPDADGEPGIRSLKAQVSRYACHAFQN